MWPHDQDKGHESGRSKWKHVSVTAALEFLVVARSDGKPEPLCLIAL
jgi:hypothetical protein